MSLDIFYSMLLSFFSLNPYFFDMFFLFFLKCIVLLSVGHSLYFKNKFYDTRRTEKELVQYHVLLIHCLELQDLVMGGPATSSGDCWHSSEST